MRYLIDGCYGDGNVGDEALLQAVRCLIGEIDPTPEFRVLTNNPAGTRAMHGTESIQRNNPFGWGIYGAIVKGQLFELARALAWCDCFILGGGELFRDDVGLRATIGMFYPFILAKALRKRVIALGIGAQQPRTATGTNILQSALLAADAIVFRDPESLEIAARLVGRSDKFSWAPDLVFSLPSPTPDSTLNYSSDESRSTLRIAIAVKGLPARLFNKEDYRRLFNSVTEAMCSLSKHYDLTINVLTFGDGDLEIGRQIGTMLCDRGINVEFEFSLDIDRIRLALSKTQMAIAMPLHASILAIAAGILAVGLSYDAKVMKLHSQFGLQEFCIPCKSFTASELIETIKSRLESGASTAGRVAGQVQLAKSRIRGEVERVFSLSRPV